MTAHPKPSVKRIIAGDASAARDLLKKYDEQREAERIKERDDRRAWLADMAGDFAGNPALVAWADAKWESDKAKGQGTKMEPDLARAWNLKMLRFAVADVCQAFDIPVDAIVNRQPAEAASRAREERLREALESIANPLAYLQREAVAKGLTLAPHAYSIATDLGFLQGIARAALSASDGEGV